MGVEVNFDGLIGPTHNYAGLSWGNRASTSNAKAGANPRLAVKQGLAKMKSLCDLGLVQGVFPPIERPSLDLLRRVGFCGTDHKVIEQVAKVDKGLLAACYSASSMWTANTATVSPGADTRDGKTHFTPANLINKLHRSVEAPGSYRMLKAIFNSDQYFKVHHWLPEHPHFGDEGAANHTRLCDEYSGESGVEFFVYGCSAGSAVGPKVFPARQTLEGAQAVARMHGLDLKKCVFAQQNPKVIDQGVFHNDVIAVGNRNVLFLHELAYLDQDRVAKEIRAQFTDKEFYMLAVREDQVPVEEAVRSYLFNSQLISLPAGAMALILPKECEESSVVWSYLQELIQQDNPIEKLIVQDVRESMKNGGGPACLRLRVALSSQELNAVHGPILLNELLFDKLNAWAEDNYRDKLLARDLEDPNYLDEVRTCLDELTQVLALGSFYNFQK